MACRILPARSYWFRTIDIYYACGRDLLWLVAEGHAQPFEGIWMSMSSGCAVPHRGLAEPVTERQQPTEQRRA